jgi:hypothetical protein
MDEWYNTVKTDLVEVMGNNNPMSSVKSIFCGLGCHHHYHCHHNHHHSHYHHIPCMAKLFKGGVFCS